MYRHITHTHILLAMEVLSAWLHFSGGMPQGPRIGPLSFLVLINDLKLNCYVQKYANGTTLSETLYVVPHTSKMDVPVQELQNWTDCNHMMINFSKTKKMLLGPLSRCNLPKLSIGDNLTCLLYTSDAPTNREV